MVLPILDKKKAKPTVQYPAPIGPNKPSGKNPTTQLPGPNNPVPTIQYPAPAGPQRQSGVGSGRRSIAPVTTQPTGGFSTISGEEVLITPGGQEVGSATTSDGKSFAKLTPSAQRSTSQLLSTQRSLQSQNYIDRVARRQTISSPKFQSYNIESRPYVEQVKTGEFIDKETGKKIPIVETRYVDPKVTDEGYGEVKPEIRKATPEEAVEFEETVQAQQNIELGRDKSSSEIIRDAKEYFAKVGNSFSTIDRDLSTSFDKVGLSSKNIAHGIDIIESPLPLPKKSKEFVKDFSKDIVLDLKEHPLRNAALYGLSAGVGGVVRTGGTAAKSIGKKIFPFLIKTKKPAKEGISIATIGKYGLGAGYAGVQGYRIYTAKDQKEAAQALADAVRGAGLTSLGYSSGIKSSDFLFKPKIVSREPVPKPKTSSFVDVQPTIVNDQEFNKAIIKSKTFIKERKGIEQSRASQFFGFQGRSVVLSPAQKRFGVANIIEKDGQILRGIAATTKPGRATTLKSIYKLSGSTGELSMTSIKDLTALEKRMMLKGFGNKQYASFPSDTRFYRTSGQAVKIFSVSGKPDKQFVVKVPQSPGKTTTTMASLSAARELPVRDDSTLKFFAEKSITADISRSTRARNLLRENALVRVREPQSYNEFENLAKGLGSKTLSQKTGRAVPTLTQQKRALTKALETQAKRFAISRTAQKISEINKLPAMKTAPGASPVFLYAGTGQYERTEAYAAFNKQLISKESNMFKLEPVIKESVVTAQPLNFLTRTKISLSHRTRDHEALASIAALSQNNQQLTTQKNSQQLKQGLLQAQRTKQNLRLIQVRKIQQIPKTPERFRLFRPLVRPTSLPPFGFSFKKKSQQGVGGSLGFRTYFIKKGKEVFLPGIREKGAALRYGERFTLKNVKATFGIKPTPIKIQGTPTNYKPSSYLFRSYRIKQGKRIPLNDTFIQKKGKRLSNIFEVSSLLSYRGKK